MMPTSTKKPSAEKKNERKSESQDSMEVFLALRPSNNGQSTSSQMEPKSEVQQLFDETETGERPEYPDFPTTEPDVTDDDAIDMPSGSRNVCVIGPEEVANFPATISDLLIVRQLLLQQKCVEMTMMLFLNPILQNCLDEDEQRSCVRLMTMVLRGPETEVHRVKEQYTDFFYEFENYKNAVGMGSPAVFNILKKIEQVLITIRQQIRSQYAASLSGTQDAIKDQPGSSHQTAAPDQNGSEGSSRT